MSYLPDLEARVATLETKYDALDREIKLTRQEVADHRRATNASFNAMREDLADLRTEVRTGFKDIRDVMDRQFGEIDKSFLNIRGTLDGQAAGMAAITNLLTVLIDQQNGQSAK